MITFAWILLCIVALRAILLLILEDFPIVEGALLIFFMIYLSII